MLEIMTYIDSEDSEASDISVDSVNPSPTKSRARKS